MQPPCPLKLSPFDTDLNFPSNSTDQKTQPKWRRECQQELFTKTGQNPSISDETLIF